MFSDIIYETPFVLVNVINGFYFVFSAFIFGHCMASLLKPTYGVKENLEVGFECGFFLTQAFFHKLNFVLKDFC